MNNEWPVVLMVLAGLVFTVGMLSDCAAKDEAGRRDHQYRMKQLELNCPGAKVEAESE